MSKSKVGQSVSGWLVAGQLPVGQLQVGWSVGRLVVWSTLDQLHGLTCGCNHKSCLALLKMVSMYYMRNM